MNPIIVIIIGTAVVMVGIIKLKLHPIISLLLAALVTGLLTTPDMLYQYAIHSGMTVDKAAALAKENISDRLATAFGNTSAKIGILIALASIIGTALMRSGGAERIIRNFLAVLGNKNAAISLALASFFLTIPVFFDTVFYLMIPLVKSLSIRNLKKFSLYLMAIIAGGVMAHSLVPPTPGPLFVAKELKVDIGVMMIGGIIVGLTTVAAGLLYAIWANKKWGLLMRNTIDISNEDLAYFSAKKNEELPPLWFSLLPVVLPILLITANTIFSINSKDHKNLIQQIFGIIGSPIIALFISCCVAMLLLWKSLKIKTDLSKYTTEALTNAGIIILIIASGGAFGQMLQQTGIGIKIGELASNYQMAILPMAFIITAIVRTAQGSATVAMVTTIGVMSGTVTNNLHFHPVYLALAIGCGSKVFAWMNDSAFWVITKMTGMEVKETIKHFSYLLVIMAVTGLITVMILSQIFPMV
jgi:GntP family gluconate:H+ symporter